MLNFLFYLFVELSWKKKRKKQQQQKKQTKQTNNNNIQTNNNSIQTKKWMQSLDRPTHYYTAGESDIWFSSVLEES